MEPFSWSVTRARTFRECPRRYYYRYHVAPLGRKPGAPPEALKAHDLKDLIGLEAWVGAVVHQVLEAALNHWRARRVFGETEAQEHAARLLRRQFRDSQTYWSADSESWPTRPVLLDLHYYSRASLDRDRAAQLKERTFRALSAFLQSELAQTIQSAGPASWLPADRNASTHLKDGTLILVKPDFAFRKGDGLHLLDWKTGKPDPFWETVQLACYALYAREKWGHPLERIFPQIAYLGEQLQLSSTSIDAGWVQDVAQFIRESREEMAAPLEGGATPTAGLFPTTEDSGRRKWCPFRGICDGSG